MEIPENHSYIVARHWLRLVGVTFVSWIAVAILLWPSQANVLNWDEVDYLNAARQGVIGNALERNSRSAVEFLRFAQAKKSGATYVSEGYDENVDPFLIRHFHPPLVIYLQAAIVGWSNHPGERLVRAVQLLGGFVFLFALFASYRNLSGGFHWPGLLIVAVLGVWMCFFLFSSVQFHGWAAIWSLATAAFLSTWLAKPEPWRGILVCLSVALSTLTLETGLIVLVGVLVSVFFWKPQIDSRQKRWRLYAIGLLLIAVFTFLLWPGGLIKISPLKTLAMHIYRVRLGEEYSGVSFVSIGKSLAPILIVIVPACVWVVYARRDEARRWGPFVTIGAIYAVTLIKFAIGTHYLLPALAPLVTVTGYGIDQVRRGFPRATIAVATVILLGYTVFARHSPGANGQWRRDLDVLREELRGRQTLAVGAHIFHYYLGENYDIRPIRTLYDGELIKRRNGQNEPLSLADVTGNVIVIVDPPYNRGVKAPEAKLLAGCSRKAANMVRVYDCGKPF